MNSKEELTCKYCNEIYKNPIILNCCDESICKQHIEELMSKENSSKQFPCPLCNKDNLNQKLNINKFMQKMIENKLHDFRIDSKYKVVLDDLKSEINKFENFFKDPEYYIHEEISELKRQVDLDREKLKNEIDDLSDDLIKQLESSEKKFKAEYKANINLEQYKRLLESSKKQLAEYESCLSFFSTINEERDRESRKSEDVIISLQSEIDETKKRLFSNLSITYKPAKKEGSLFGKLHVEVNVILSIFWVIKRELLSEKIIFSGKLIFQFLKLKQIT